MPIGMSALSATDRRSAPERVPARGRAASSDAYRQIYREHHRFVWRCLLRLGVPEAAIEDALQEVFVTAFRRLHTLQQRASLRAWLGGIARRVAFRYRRTRDRAERRRLALAEIEPEHACTDEWLRRRRAATFLQRFVEQLDRDKREVFVMCELEGMRGREAAAALGVNENTAYARLRAARSLFEAACHRAHGEDLARQSQIRRIHEGDGPPRDAARRSLGIVLSQLGPPPALLASHASVAGTTKAVAKTSIAAKLVGLGAGVKAAIAATVIGATAIMAGPVANAIVIERDAGSRNQGARPRTDAPIVDHPNDAQATAVLPGDGPGFGPDGADLMAPVPIPTAIEHGGPSRTAATSGSSAVTRTIADPLARQLEIIESAQRAAARGEWHDALQAAKQYRAEFSHGALAREATAIVVEALCVTGDRVKAKAEALTWLGTTEGARLFAQTCDESP